MHVLYIDDSGSVGNPDERFFVLGGISVFERGIYHLIKDCDECVEQFGIGDAVDVELHGSEAYSGRGRIWGALKSRAERESKIQSALDLLARPRPAVKLFAVAVDKAAVSPRDPIELAFEEVCNRFNLFLQRNNNRNNHKERGLLVMDKSKHERPLQSLARHFRVNGATWGQFRNLAEVPLFVDSTSSRLVQLADRVAWSTWRKFEHQDGRFFDKLIPRFDADGGVIHGLYHAKGSSVPDCYCPACHSRAMRQPGET